MNLQFRELFLQMLDEHIELAALLPDVLLFGHDVGELFLDASQHQPEVDLLLGHGTGRKRAGFVEPAHRGVPRVARGSVGRDGGHG